MTLSTRDFANTIFDILEVSLHAAQEPIVFDETNKQIIVSGGEQGGKSFIAALFLLLRLFITPERCWICDYRDADHEGMKAHINARKHGGFFWLVGESYAETEREFHYLKEHLQALNIPIDAPDSIDPGHITLTVDGTRIETKSAKDVRKFSKVAPRGIVICEASQVDYVIYERCRTRITGNDGFLLMPGTIEKGIPWFPRMRKAWAMGYDKKKSYMLPSYTNLTLYPGGRNDPKILELERDSSDENFLERIEGQEVPVKGLVFAEARLDVHVRDIPYDPNLVCPMPGCDANVHIWEDPGFGSESAHAIELAQILPDFSVNVFDEIYVRGKLQEDIIKSLQKRHWWKRKKRLVSDPHYKTQHHSTSSVEEIWKNTGLISPRWDYEKYPRVPINAGSERLKSFLKVDDLSGQTKITFNPRCRGIFSEFGLTTSVFNKERDEPYIWDTDDFGDHRGKVPIDKYNHACKAVIYGLVEHFGYTKSVARNQDRQRSHLRGGRNSRRRVLTHA